MFTESKVACYSEQSCFHCLRWEIIFLLFWLLFMLNTEFCKKKNPSFHIQTPEWSGIVTPTGLPKLPNNRQSLKLGLAHITTDHLLVLFLWVQAARWLPMMHRALLQSISQHSSCIFAICYLCVLSVVRFCSVLIRGIFLLFLLMGTSSFPLSQSIAVFCFRV